MVADVEIRTNGDISLAASEGHENEFHGYLSDQKHSYVAGHTVAQHVKKEMSRRR